MEKSMTGMYSFKRLVNGKGFYCGVKLEVIITEELGVVIDCYSNSVWLNSIRFAVDYFYEGYSIGRKGGFRVTVSELDSQIVDTSHMVVFYVTLKALCRAFSMNDDVQIILTEEGNFVFPKILLIP